MDNILPQLLAFPPHQPPTDPIPDAEYDKRIKAIVQTLSGISANKLTGGLKGGGDLLEVLDPSANTLPYLYVLLAHINAPSGKQKRDVISDNFTPNEKLWTNMVNFMERFDPVQIRYGGHEIRRLIELTALRARQLHKPSLAVSPIRTAILRIDPSSSTFTSSHHIFAQLCLEARTFASALPVLDKDIYFLHVSSEKQAEAALSSLAPYPCSKHDSSSTFITPHSGLSEKLLYQSYLQYFLFGAMIYMALRDWERAQFFLEVVIASPTTGPASKIQIDAYKKWVLAGLLNKGRVPRTPKNISSHVIKAYQAIAIPYLTLADVFQNGIRNDESDGKLVAEAQYGHMYWREDSNSALVGQVIHAFRQFSVQHLETTYTALTVADITRRTSPDPNNYADTANYVLHLVSVGQLNASVSRPSADPRSWVVRFGEGQYARSEEQQLEKLKRQTRKLYVLMDHVREADRQMGISKEYVQEARKAQKAKGDYEDGDLAGAYVTGSFGEAEDEDMMADL